MGLVRTMPSSGQPHRPGLKARPCRTDRTDAGVVGRDNLTFEDPAAWGHAWLGAFLYTFNKYRTICSMPGMGSGSVLSFYGCYNKSPPMCWLKIVFSQFSLTVPHTSSQFPHSSLSVLSQFLTLPSQFPHSSLSQFPHSSLSQFPHSSLGPHPPWQLS